ncbi:hypothetical protein BKP45_10400 [Anaerobacillus alkalidiazotrophicus]|uniref:Spore germination protein n=1 Tax=Anaerobacillus alkalidiazotrophicus TaxID=472963 RepID=A0A1S2M639_9BACI|nr:spore germination protein [Anaerobacillus alkalidiazotrophicus]OIJ20076.1 hypothetical protein BKP45_10400 [Anaerobacillus alkalidiazotrophicus]
MFQWLKKKLKWMIHKQYSNGQTQPNDNSTSKSESVAQTQTKPVYKNVYKNAEEMKRILGENEGVFNRTFTIGKQNGKFAYIFAVSGMVDTKVINENILSPLMNLELPNSPSETVQFLKYLKESVLTISEVEFEENLLLIPQIIFTGKVILFIDAEDKALVIDAQAMDVRGIEQSVNESVLRGARDAFNEDIGTNLSLVRRRIRDPKLHCEPMIIGKQTHTKVVITYIDGIVNKDILNEVKKRINNIQIDSVLESGVIEQLIEDAPYSLFPTIGNVEKPDTVAAELLEGRVAIFVDGTPFVLTVPHLLVNHFQVAEDYYSRPIYSNFVRLLRILSFFISVMLPGVFVAFQYYHSILIPFDLLITLAKERAEVPFQLIVETIGMLIVFEIIKESGLRMPKPIGQAVSIVGALILGEAAVQAGLVGIPVVVTIAIVGIASFPVSTLGEAISILRILFVFAGAALGLFGILILGMVVVSHLASLRSFGVPYSAPLFPIKVGDLKDSIIRFPLSLLVRRPLTFKTENQMNQTLGGDSGEGQRGKE